MPRKSYEVTIDYWPSLEELVGRLEGRKQLGECDSLVTIASPTPPLPISGPERLVISTVDWCGDMPAMAEMPAWLKDHGQRPVDIREMLCLPIDDTDLLGVCGRVVVCLGSTWRHHDMDVAPILWRCTRRGVLLNLTCLGEETNWSGIRQQATEVLLPVVSLT